jgi:hypothetical protein
MSNQKDWTVEFREFEELVQEYGEESWKIQRADHSPGEFDIETGHSYRYEDYSFAQPAVTVYADPKFWEMVDTIYDQTSEGWEKRKQ